MNNGKRTVFLLLNNTIVAFAVGATPLFLARVNNALDEHLPIELVISCSQLLNVSQPCVIIQQNP
jgi:hypothetical protein